VPLRLTRFAHRIENLAVALALLAMGLLPVLEILLRGLFSLGLPGSVGYVQNLTLWVGFLGAIIASRERRHLNLSTAELVLPAGAKPAAQTATAFVSVAVGAGLFWASLQFVLSDMADPVRIGGWLPLWCVEAVLPVSFLVITLRFVTQAGRLPHQLAALGGIPFAAVVGLYLAPYAQDILARRSSSRSAAPPWCCSSPTACRSPPSRWRPTASSSRRPSRAFRCSP
jgi:TRAP-type C4-dicarboxylate transport system permease small subunit